MKKAIILLGLAVIGFTGCKKKNETLIQPKSSFILSTTECYVGESFSTTNLSSNASGYEWSVDGTYFSSTSDINYTTKEASLSQGISVTLKTVSSDGLSDYSTKYVKVKNFSEAFKGTYTPTASNTCFNENVEMEVLTYSEWVDFSFYGVDLSFKPTSKTSGTISANYTTYSDGSQLIVKSGSVYLNNGILTLTINYTYYDSNYNSTSDVCVSTFTKD